MFHKLKALIAEDRGAVTVEWVVITAAVIGMGMIFLTPIAFGTSSVTTKLGDKIGTAAVGYGN